MSAATTATVETLTAEVHVLKVGNRQITLSVAKQLDVIPFDRLRPFGRIHLNGPPRRETDSVDVVGVDIETGALCRSRLARNYDSRPWKQSQVERDNANHAAARALPLIVLAGLR